MTQYLLLIYTLIILACNNPNKNSDLIKESTVKDTITNVMPEIVYSNDTFSRDSVRHYSQLKNNSKSVLTVHVFVPLCDNENQGIVPVAPHLGDGSDLVKNLYWGAGHGMKSYFKYSNNWELLESEIYNNDTILERCVFRKKTASGLKILLVADAYKGDKMKTCLQDYLSCLAGKNKETIIIDKDTILIKSDADMLCFSGHNGLMDMDIEPVKTVDGIKREGVVISCYSGYYFNRFFRAAQAYPLVFTSGLLYPGAFILDDVISSWATGKSRNECRIAAGESYNRIMKCGRQAGINLFLSGWSGYDHL